jgi:LysM repeat protein
MMTAFEKQAFRRSASLSCVLLAAASILSLTGCDRMATPPRTQIVKDADEKVSQGEYISAVGLYESVLDGTAQSADIHYKLGLLYDSKMNDAVNALHHFKRYLVLRPTGGHASEVRDFIKRDETALLTSLSGDSVVTRGEASRLRNENLSLRKQLEERVLKPKAEEKASDRKTLTAKATAVHSGNQSYVVEHGDTLFSISRKFYKSPSHWKEIRDANREKIDSTSKLKPGTTLTIP